MRSMVEGAAPSTSSSGRPLHRLRTVPLPAMLAGEDRRLPHLSHRHVDLVVARSSPSREGRTAGSASATNEGEDNGKSHLGRDNVLDGFTSGPNVRAEEPMGDGGEGLHSWMGATGPDSSVDAGVFDMLNANIGGILIGRRTFDLGLKNWGGTPWPNTPSFVITHRTGDDLKGDNGGTFAFGNIEDSVRRAREAAGDGNVIVLGADVARQLLTGRSSRRDLAPHLAHPLGRRNADVRWRASDTAPAREAARWKRDPHFFRVANA